MVKYGTILDGSELEGSEESYRVIQKLGEGAFSRAYHIKRLSDGTNFVLKTPKDSDHFRRLYGEKDFLKRFSHSDYVIKIHGFVSMRYDRKKTHGLILEHGGIPLNKSKRVGQTVVQKAVEVAVKIGRGLMYLHKNGIIHRDVKPPNIFVEKRSLEKGFPFDRADVKIGDLDSATLRNSGDVETRYGVGTEHYIAPEAIYGEDSEKSDMYSLARTVRWMIMADGRDGLGEKQRLGLEEWISKHDGSLRKDFGIPKKLDNLLLSGISENPSRRISAAGFVAEIEKMRF